MGGTLAAAASASAAPLPAAAVRRYAQGPAPNDRIGVGFIGVGNRGTQLLNAFLGFPDVELVAICDVYEPYLHRRLEDVDPVVRAEVGHYIPRMGEKWSERVARYRDYRRLLERSDIDAVVIATPDHWHALQTIDACTSGKDVYVEKPLTVTVTEGRRMIEVAAQTGRVVQVGLQRRSSEVYVGLPELIRGGAVGKVTVCRAYRVSNMAPAGIGRKSPQDPPPDLDWNLWLGPRPWRPYQSNIHPYRFRWWQDYSSQVGNWGVHYFDVIRWVIGEQAPRYISAVGGRYAIDDDRTIPDTMEVTFEFPGGALLTFGQYEACGGEVAQGEIEIRGTRGNLLVSTVYEKGAGYRIESSPAGQFGTPEAAREHRLVTEETDSTPTHVRNFLDCVRTRQTPACPLEEGHRSTTFALLANIALATGSRLEWDAENEKVIQPADANRWLSYRYRDPWRD
jgi:predicted dehydrogenase